MNETIDDLTAQPSSPNETAKNHFENKNCNEMEFSKTVFMISVPASATDSNAIIPVQNSSQHILNALNNDCMKEIMRKLKSIEDYLNAAQVCTCFQENAKKCFPPNFKAIRIDDSESAAQIPNNLPLERVESFMSIFGPLISSIEWNFTHGRYHDEAILNMIAKFCGKTLSTFTIHGHDLDFNTESQFEDLEKLTLYDSTISNFTLLPQLKSLKLASIKVAHSDWLTQEFPKLEEAKFYAFHKLRDKMLLEFLQLNPQLHSLKLNCCRRITPSVFQDIDTRSPNLMRLNIDPSKGLQSTFDTNMVHLSRLRKLTSLRIECHKFSGRALIDSLAENDVPIKYLTVVGAVRDLAESIPKLKQLKMLWLSFIFEEMFVNIAKELTELTEFTVDRSYDVTLCGIKEVLEIGKKLSQLSVRMDAITMDLEDFNAVLNLAKDRVHVELLLDGGTAESHG